MRSSMGVAWIRMAAIYLVVGVSLGIHMGKSHDFSLAPVHAHINLLGWATMALMGIIHHQFGAALNNKLAHIQFWLHQVGAPIMLVSLGLMLSGNAAMEPVVGLGSIVVGVSILLFLVNVWRNLRSSP